MLREFGIFKAAEYGSYWAYMGVIPVNLDTYGEGGQQQFTSGQLL
jgi:hypothetical protein